MLTVTVALGINFVVVLILTYHYIIYVVFCIVGRIQLPKSCICIIQIPYVGIIFVHRGGVMANTRTIDAAIFI